MADSPNPPAIPAPHLPLCQLPAGTRGRVLALAGDAPFCQRVREMGFGEDAVITKLSGRGTTLCQVGETRLALSHEAARRIQVQVLAPPAPSAPSPGLS
ncbi:FeoA family protein [Cephaloticoccus primus]|uniref:FeoA family protein n=1 Tax=Cephaloticoccus primus TaxID=1548207 RepID=UPI0009ECFB7C|nr:FeoA family protein [Cephaloticoccus primus]